MTTRYYTDLKPAETDLSRWTVAHALRGHAAQRPEATYLIAPEEGREFSYAQMLDGAERVAGGMRARGAADGDRVVIMASNSSRFVFSWLGCGVGALVEAPINTAYEGEFLRHQVSLVGARWAVIDDVFAERFTVLHDALPSLEGFWVIDTGRLDAALNTLRGAGWSAEPWETLLAADRLVLPDPAPHQLASVFYTSGTTGPSKGVSMPHGQMYMFGSIVVSLTRLTSADTYLTVTPLFHGNAQFMAAYPALIAGGRLVIRSRFSASRWADQLRENQVTVTNMIGVMMDFIWKQPRRPDDADNVLRCVYAAPTAFSVLPEFMERFGVEAFVDAFGLTETCAPIISPYGEMRPAGSQGLLASEWFEARLVDPETDQEVPVGTVGELVVRYKHPWTCSLGYYGMPDKTAQAWRNLWFHTGDALRRDEEGWYYFVDRYKDTLRRRGENISSYEVEQVILAHPAVTECAVIGVPSEVEAGEDEVMAVIVTAAALDGPGPPAAAVDATEIFGWCTGRMPAFAIPRFIRFADALPRTPSEKIRKAELRDQGTSGAFDLAARPSTRRLATTPVAPRTISRGSAW
ncbi:MAG TPA: AMP-binding protein [Streptosporangiaceae bacterium]